MALVSSGKSALLMISSVLPPTASRRKISRSTRAALRLWLAVATSFSAVVLSSASKVSPFLTRWPSCTLIFVTTPEIAGWIILVLPSVEILPLATATISILPKYDHANATISNNVTSQTTNAPSGAAGVSTISSAAGKNSYCSRSRFSQLMLRLLTVAYAGTRTNHSFSAAPLAYHIQPIDRDQWP